MGHGMDDDVRTKTYYRIDLKTRKIESREVTNRSRVMVQFLNPIHGRTDWEKAECASHRWFPSEKQALSWLMKKVRNDLDATLKQQRVLEKEFEKLQKQYMKVLSK